MAAPLLLLPAVPHHKGCCFFSLLPSSGLHFYEQNSSPHWRIKTRVCALILFLTISLRLPISYTNSFREFYSTPVPCPYQVISLSLLPNFPSLILTTPRQLRLARYWLAKSSRRMLTFLYWLTTQTSNNHERTLHRFIARFEHTYPRIFCVRRKG